MMIAKIKSWYRFINPKFQTVHLDYIVQVKPRYTKENGGHPELQEIIVQHESVYAEIITLVVNQIDRFRSCLLYTSPSPRDLSTSRMPSSA